MQHSRSKWRAGVHLGGRLQHAYCVRVRLTREAARIVLGAGLLLASLTSAAAGDPAAEIFTGIEASITAVSGYLGGGYAFGKGLYDQGWRIPCRRQPWPLRLSGNGVWRMWDAASGHASRSGSKAARSVIRNMTQDAAEASSEWICTRSRSRSPAASRTILSKTDRAASVAQRLSRLLILWLGALPAPPRQCWPHRRGVRRRFDRISRSCGRRAHLGRAFCVRELAGMPERKSLRKERMTQGVSQSKREFAPSLIFLSMASTLLSCGIRSARLKRMDFWR